MRPRQINITSEVRLTLRWWDRRRTAKVLDYSRRLPNFAFQLEAAKAINGKRSLQTIISCLGQSEFDRSRVVRLLESANVQIVGMKSDFLSKRGVEPKAILLLKGGQVNEGDILRVIHNGNVFSLFLQSIQNNGQLIIIEENFATLLAAQEMEPLRGRVSKEEKLTTLPAPQEMEPLRGRVSRMEPSFPLIEAVNKFIEQTPSVPKENEIKPQKVEPIIKPDNSTPITFSFDPDARASQLLTYIEQAMPDEIEARLREIGSWLKNNERTYISSGYDCRGAQNAIVSSHEYGTQGKDREYKKKILDQILYHLINYLTWSILAPRIVSVASAGTLQLRTERMKKIQGMLVDLYGEAFNGEQISEYCSPDFIGKALQGHRIATGIEQYQNRKKFNRDLPPIIKFYQGFLEKIKQILSELKDQGSLAAEISINLLMEWQEDKTGRLKSCSNWFV